MSLVASIIERAAAITSAGSSAFLALALGMAPDDAASVGLYADKTAGAEQLCTVVGGVVGPKLLRTGSDVIGTGWKVQDSTFQIADNGDLSKTIAFQCASMGSGFQLTIDSGAQAANRTLSVPALTGNATLAVLEETQTFSGAKTFSNASGVAITTSLIVDSAAGLTASTAPAIRLNGATAGDTIALGSTWTTSKFDSQGTVWTSRALGGAIVFNQGSADRPEINWYRGSRSYPEFSIRQHGSADTGGQIYAGPGTAAPTLVASFASTGLTVTPSLTVTTTTTNVTATYAMTFTRSAGTSSSGTHNARAVSGAQYGTIASGQTNSGAWASLWSECLRNYVATGDTGTLTSLIGISINYGHFNTDASTPTTTEIKGLRLGRFASTGTVGTMYGIHIENGSTTITPTTAYGIRIENTLGTSAWAIHTGSGIVSFGDTTDATSSTAAAVTMTGGLAVAKGQYIGTFLNVAGLVGFGGTTNSQAVMYVGSNNPLTGTTQVGGIIGLTGTSAATTSIRGFQAGIATAAAAFTCADAIAIMSGTITQGAGSTITRSTCVWACNPNSGTNKASLVVGGTSLSYTGNWAIYSQSTDASYFAGNVQLADVNLVIGTTTGTKIGTATGQKIGFWNATPVIQPASANQAAVSTTGATNTTPYGYTTAAQADGIITLLNEIRSALVTTGLMKGAA